MIRSKNIFLEVYNFNMEKIGQIHNIVSLQWTIAFRDIGSFELICVVDDLTLVQAGYYLSRSDTRHVGQITDVSISRDINGINTITVHGVDALNLLNQRVNTRYRYLENKRDWEIMQELIAPNLEGVRDIPFLEDQVTAMLILINNKQKYSVALDRETIYSLIMQVLPANYDIETEVRRIVQRERDPDTGEVLREWIEYVISIKLVRIDPDTKPALFSDKLGNINAWSWHQNIGNYKNVAYVMGEGEGSNRTCLFAGEGYRGTRREVAIDARDLSRDTEDGRLTVDQYKQVLRQRGQERLTEYPDVREVSLEVNENINVNWVGRQVYCETNVFTFEGFISAITQVFDATGYSIFPSITINQFIRTIATESLIDITTEDEEVLTT